jgi:putative Holliday junction resolvase
LKRQLYLGFDYGERTIGVAVGSKDTGLAQPLTTIHVGKKGPDWISIGKLIDEWQPAALVVGLPIKMDETDNPVTSLARKFGNQLKARYNLAIHMVDERLTTIEAKHRLQEAGVAIRPGTKPKIDEMAAQTILQAFLDEDSQTGS